MQIKILSIFYGRFLPLITVIVLLGVASVNIRPQLSESDTIDIFVRVVFTFWFSALYIRLSKLLLDSGTFTSGWSLNDIKTGEKNFYIVMTLLFGVGSGFFTWLIIKWFFPAIQSFSYIISSLNVIIISYPIIVHYWVFKI
jgi:hypothetical protein